MLSRRCFLGGSAILLSVGAIAEKGKPNGRQGDFDDSYPGEIEDREWEPFSDRKVRVGIAGFGYCKFGAAFGYQNHPNVEVVACTDLDPERCASLQMRVKATKAYHSCEEMIRYAAEDGESLKIPQVG